MRKKSYIKTCRKTNLQYYLFHEWHSGRQKENVRKTDLELSKRIEQIVDGKAFKATWSPSPSSIRRRLA
jgi:hypothetical protein